MKTYGVIMAGGGGTRFWPLSRKQTPKQLLNLSGKDLMINESVERLARVADYGDIFIVTNASQKYKMRQSLVGAVKRENILSEPAARNTAACIGYAAVKILKTYGDGVMVITPSDAYIKDTDKFAATLKIAVAAATESDKLITVGITPTFPATGYGYIKFERGDGEVKKVERFVEKPDSARAKEYIESGDYVWNSGMFVWKISVILEKFKKYLPDIYERLIKIYNAVGTESEERVLNEIYPDVRSVSIDYGIMEKSEDICVIPSEFGWNDVGSWDMMSVFHKPDESGNIEIGDVVSVDTKNTTAYSSGKLIATVGVENLIIVQTDDAVLVCAADRAQDVKKIVDKLKEDGRENLL